MKAGPVALAVVGTAAVVGGGNYAYEHFTKKSEAESRKPTPEAVTVAPAEEERESRIADTRDQVREVAIAEDVKDAPLQLLEQGHSPGDAVASEEKGRKQHLENFLPNAPGVKDRCDLALSDPSPSVRGRIDAPPEEIEVIRLADGKYVGCNGEPFEVRRGGDEWVLKSKTNSNSPEYVLDPKYGLEGLGGTKMIDGVLHRNLVMGKAYLRIAKAEVEGIRKERDRLKGQNTKLRKNLDDALAKLKKLMSENEQLRKEIGRLQRELEAAQKLLAECDEALKKCLEECKEPEKKHQAYKRRGAARGRHERVREEIEKKGEELGFAPEELNQLLMRERIQSTKRTYQLDDGTGGTQNYVEEASPPRFDADGTFHMEE